MQANRSMHAGEQIDACGEWLLLPLKAKVERNSRWFPMKANRSERAQKLGDC